MKAPYKYIPPSSDNLLKNRWDNERSGEIWMFGVNEKVYNNNS
tara:strand:+ start:186 stop:314 length:129 start_codon:yes stop_codon:yes gene_type:complete